MKFPTLKCEKCNHAWMPRVERVKECPKCKNRNWDKKRNNKNAQT